MHFSEEDTKFRYEDDGIYTNSPQNAIHRNKVKSNNLDIISSTVSVYSNIPIETYYFSCNLDHVLHNIRNLEQDKKESCAESFSDRLEGKEVEFISIINGTDIVNGNEYKESWERIREDLQSLFKNSNFHVFFKRNREFLNEEAKKAVDSFELL